jgi:hypothetical protein
MDPLFGSETRARLLEQLALSPRPRSAYRLARIIEAEPIQVLRILKGLSEYAERTDAGWRLTDEALRRFLIERANRAATARRAEKDELLLRFGMKPSHERHRESVR